MEEQRRLIITEVVIQGRAFCACALCHGNRLVEVNLEPSGAADSSNGGGKPPREGILGNIYVGRVKDVVKNLNAAFVEIEPGRPCYMNLKDVKGPVYVKKINSPRLVSGDQLLVQVEGEAVKTKPPKVTPNLTFMGKYLILSTQDEAVGASRKLPEEHRERLKTLLKEHRRTSFGVVARTACEQAAEETLLEELASLEGQAGEMIARAPYRTCFSCLRRQEPFYLQMLRRISAEKVEEIVTDQKEVYDRLAENFGEEKVRFYGDDLLPLSKCYSLEQRISRALQEKVWLKSGGYLLIEPTEALTVIDVNSGKSISQKTPQEHYLKVNLEAAEEIAHQLRLRNISGIVVVDFIDLKSREDQEALMQYMKELVSSDPSAVQVVDYTRLNLMELTRKKGKKSLAEQVGEN